MKVCSRCKTEKSISDFYIATNGRPIAACKSCISSASKKRYSENAERMKENARRYRAANIEACRKREREYSLRNSEARDLRVKEFYEKNPEKRREYGRRYYEKSGGRLKSRVYYQEKLRFCERHKVATAARNMLKRTLQAAGRPKTSTTKVALGYSPEALKIHLEKQFSEGMSWDNYGEWHIDHIIPVAEMIRLGITCPKRINALGNLRPLWAWENYSKGDRFELASQSLL